VFLAPVAELLQLRPSLEHLDAARPQPRAAEPVKEEEKPALTAVSVRPRSPSVQAAGKHARGRSAATRGVRCAQVHVQRRETDRQREQRTSSYAYLAAREREEPWKPLQARPGRLRPPGDLACAGACECL
jgi:hypothetical protein